jgi:hypothetical protein
MNVESFITHLKSHPERNLSLRLPDGSLVPAHFHITEIGHVIKRFADCGGVRRVQEACVLQTWVHDDEEHRLSAGKLAGVFDKVDDLFEDLSLPVEFEVELGTVAQFELGGASLVDGNLELALASKQTDCLARGVCLPGTCDADPEALLPSAATAACAPGSGCC